MIKTNLEIFKSDTKKFCLNLTKDNTPIDLTNCTIYFSVKKCINDTEYALQTIQNEHIDALNGKTIITLNSNQTDIDAGIYQYDIQFKDSTGNISTIIYGQLTIIQDITTNV